MEQSAASTHPGMVKRSFETISVDAASKSCDGPQKHVSLPIRYHPLKGQTMSDPSRGGTT